MENRPCLDSMNIGRWFDPPHIYVYNIYSSYLTSCSIEKGEEKAKILTNWLTLSTQLIIIFLPFENSVKLHFKKFLKSHGLQIWPFVSILYFCRIGLACYLCTLHGITLAVSSIPTALPVFNTKERAVDGGFHCVYPNGLAQGMLTRLIIPSILHSPVHYPSFLMLLFKLANLQRVIMWWAESLE